MKKSFMNNIKHFVDSNVRQRIDRAANNNNDFFGDDLLLVERQFEDMRHVCMETEKRISAMLQSLASSPLGAYTQNVQASLNNLSNNLSSANPSTSATPSSSTTTHHQQQHLRPLTSSSNETQFSSYHSNDKQLNQPNRFKSSTVSIANESTSITNPRTTPLTTGSNKGSGNQLHLNNCGPITDATTVIQSEELRRHKRLPIVGFLKFLVKSCYKLRSDSLLATTLTHCSHLQTQLTKLYLSYEQTIESQCLKPIQHILENDIPNVIKLRKLFIKSHNDLESVKTKYNGASHKQQQTFTSYSTSTSYTITQNNVHQTNINKLDQLKKELDDAVSRFEQARDTYATELYAFVCRETELVNLFMKFYQYQAEYQLQAGNIVQGLLPSLSNILANTPRKVVFGTSLEEHLKCTGRTVSLVIELCIHILYAKGLNEEGLFRIPGSSVKIKKLKNAINAWFVTLASQGELENDQRGSSSSVLAVHDLFKEIAGQRPQLTRTNSDTIANNQINPSVREDSSQVGFPSANYYHDLVFDVHTIAGLLKLYLRELPEPLFTHALYQQCLDASSRAVNDNQPEALEQVIRKLPKANYDNLRHLIRFLHLLTYHREFNKMTATNLAITMAPSLIWGNPANGQQIISDAQSLAGDLVQEELQTLNLQMSSIGISTSLHALVIENLINNAEALFPGPIQFSITGLDESLVDSCGKVQQLSVQDRCMESSSPTGLSTASSSSYSSTSNASRTSRDRKHSRKGGSMEGLLSNLSKSFNAHRPNSIQMSRHELVQSQQLQQPPPIPPAPTIRSHMKHVNDPKTVRSTPSSKQSAPAIPPSSNPKGQQSLTGTSQMTISGSRTFSSLVQSAIANSTCPPRTSGASSSMSSGSFSATRPTVPPPSRPVRDAPEDKVNFLSINERQTKMNKSQDNIECHSGDDRGSQSLASSGNFRNDFEEINVADMDDNSVPSVSPIVSLNDTISGEDSSFDNECLSLEHSWTDSDIAEPVSQGCEVKDSTLRKAEQIPEAVNPKLKTTTEQTVAEQGHKLIDKVIHDNSRDNSPSNPPPPVKPPRSISPRVTQSTPL